MVEITPEESARSAYTASASATAADGGISAGRRGSRSTRKAASSQVVLCKAFLFPFCDRLRPRPDVLQSQMQPILANHLHAWRRQVQWLQAKTCARISRLRS